jgi:hypothetical protein
MSHERQIPGHTLFVARYTARRHAQKYLDVVIAKICANFLKQRQCRFAKGPTKVRPHFAVADVRGESSQQFAIICWG